jgi:hypothetical protein
MDNGSDLVYTPVYSWSPAWYGLDTSVNIRKPKNDRYPSHNFSDEGYRDSLRKVGIFRRIDETNRLR